MSQLRLECLFRLKILMSLSTPPPLILASASPARAKLLQEWGFQFHIQPTQLDEDHFHARISDPKILVETLADAKACSLLEYHQNPVTIIAADTIVYFQNKRIGKPIDKKDAKRIIQSLAGNTHQVWTGVCLITKKIESPPVKHCFSDVASVTFKSMSDAEIETYLETNEWVEKAGGYQAKKAIQPHIAKIDGDINTVIGLPSLLKNQLKLLI
jgi:septum formation protein